MDKVGERLTAARMALGLKAIDVCKAIGVAQNTYSHWENGERLMDTTAAARFCTMFPITMDWLYIGRTDGMEASLRQQMLAALDAIRRQRGAA